MGYGGYLREMLGRAYGGASALERSRLWESCDQKSGR